MKALLFFLSALSPFPLNSGDALAKAGDPPDKKLARDMGFNGPILAGMRHVAAVVITCANRSESEFGKIWQGSGFAHNLLDIALCQQGKKP